MQKAADWYREEVSVRARSSELARFLPVAIACLHSPQVDYSVMHVYGMEKLMAVSVPGGSVWGSLHGLRVRPEAHLPGHDYSHVLIC